MEKANNDTAKRELRITRMLSAPIELVWEVWTNPDHIANWWDQANLPTQFINGCNGRW